MDAKRAARRENTMPEPSIRSLGAAGASSAAASHRKMSTGFAVQDSDDSRRRGILERAGSTSEEIVIRQRGALLSGRMQTEVQQRVLRIFLSSPFGGHERERDAFMTSQLPRLRALCENRGVQLMVCDLRWGVTEEQATDARVLRVCLEEISRCDIFVGSFGTRYGWHGLEDDLLQRNFDDIVQETRWAWAAQFRDRSATEIEFLDGFLNSPSKRPAVFLFRDPAYDEVADARQERENINDARHFRPESLQAKEKLAALMQKVIANKTADTVIHKSYRDPDEFAALLGVDLEAKLTRLLDSISSLDTDNVDPESAQHEAYLLSRSGIFVGRDERMKRLAQAFDNKHGSLVVTGPSGTGKSSLIANWLLLKRKQAADTDTHYLFHIAGCSRSSTSVVNMLQRLCRDLLRLLRTQYPDMSVPFTHNPDILPREETQLTEILNDVLYAIAVADDGPQVVVCIEGLDQLDVREGGSELRWLPDVSSWSFGGKPRVQILVSTLEGKALNVLKSRRWPVHAIELLNDEERTQLIDQVLNQHGKRLSPDQQATILAKEPTGNALYLRVLLEELCAHGDFYTLDARIQTLLEAEDGVHLFKLMIERLEQAHPFVASVLSNIYAARYGLSETELCDYINITQTLWSPLFFALRPFLVVRSDLISFLLRQLRHAVLQKYFPSEKSLQECRQELASYFEKKLNARSASVIHVPIMRFAEELPWLLEKSGVSDKKRMINVLSNLKVFAFLLEKYEWDLARYWRSVATGNTGGRTIAQAYQDRLLKMQQKNTEELVQQRTSFRSTAARKTSLSLSTRPLMDVDEQGTSASDPPLSVEDARIAGGGDSVMWSGDMAALEQANLYLAVGDFIRTQGYYEDGIPFYEQSLKLRQSCLGKDHLDVATAMNNLAAVYSHLGKFKEAMNLFEGALELRVKKLGEHHQTVASSIHSMAQLYKAMGEYERAKELYLRALDITQEASKDSRRRSVWMPSELQGLARAGTINNLAAIYEITGEHEKALPLYEQARVIYTEHLGPDHPDVAATIANKASVYENMGKPEQALELYEQALAVQEAKLGPEHPEVSTTLGNMAALYTNQGNFESAMPLYERAISIKVSKMGFDHPSVASSYFNVGLLHFKQRDTSQAYAYFCKASDILTVKLPVNHPDRVAVERMKKRTAHAARPGCHCLLM